ncbi:hypothetical protein NDU88_007539 [Pleurodeles waltl]|uniref:Uncharacterized protein n=1 Tax=Pleurodeles waltl TaxID=8319 RepID=A0AAV7VR37_PLEWA|nr:hypothetical protein NDU88_007539 [Pleurodeles waltl]
MKYTGGTVDGIEAAPEEAEAVEKRVRENDAEPRGVLNPELDEESHFPQEEKMWRVRKAGLTDQNTS